MTKREKIGVARPKGRPYGGSATRLADGGRGGAAPRGSQGSALKALRIRSTGRTDAMGIGASDGSRKNRRHGTLVQKGVEAKSAYRHRLNRRVKKGHRCIGRPLYQRRCQVPRKSVFSTGSTDGASVHWPSFVPETMSSAQEKCLQHRFNRWGIGAYHRCNDVSVQEKIPSAPVEPVKHRCKASVQPVVTASAVRSSMATSVYE